jgi:hypothetical protein
MMLMKHFLLLFIVLSFSINLYSQREGVDNGNPLKQEFLNRDLHENIVTIYPVPVQDNSFTIKSTKEISYIKVTNIIGQEIFRIKFSTPQLFFKINLDNPGRGMYLVVILFSDNSRIVKKIMIENAE